uniref:Methyltransferase domain-containing protein n=1 Tax=Thermus islandicus TaxID=540988 RepID=A0A7C2G4V5_9DEIN
MDPFASLAEAYEAWYETPLGAHVIAEEERVLRGLLPPGESLLEVGAGTGYWLRRLPYPRRVGVEPSEAMLAVGRRRAPEATWVRARGEALPFPGGRFDVVLLFTTLEFVEDVERVLQEARRVLRPGGALVVGILDALSPWAALYRRLGEKGVRPWSHARFLAREDLACLLGPPEAEGGAVYLAPEASPPFSEADLAGRRAGNRPALYLGRWR